jgi:hypothetical protein
MQGLMPTGNGEHESASNDYIYLSQPPVHINLRAKRQQAIRDQKGAKQRYAA